MNFYIKTIHFCGHHAFSEEYSIIQLKVLVRKYISAINTLTVCSMYKEVKRNDLLNHHMDSTLISSFGSNLAKHLSESNAKLVGSN